MAAGSFNCWRWPGVVFEFPPAFPYVAGILNVTPDSFSDGGSYASAGEAVARALALAGEGAAIIDVGGQSTRPGALPVSLAEEERRVLPVLTALREALGGSPVRISLDTDKPEMADKVLSLGLADILNDESGGDPDMARAAASHNTPLVLMHRPEGDDRGSLAAVTEDLAAIRSRYIEAGLPGTFIALDPGLGFGKNEEENLLILSDCRRLLELGGPVYIGASRKRFIGKYGGNPEAGKRLGGSLAAAVWAASCGASFVRVHDVKETVEAFAMTEALRSAFKNKSKM